MSCPYCRTDTCTREATASALRDAARRPDKVRNNPTYSLWRKHFDAVSRCDAAASQRREQCEKNIAHPLDA